MGWGECCRERRTFFRFLYLYWSCVRKGSVWVSHFLFLFRRTETDWRLLTYRYFERLSEWVREGGMEGKERKGWLGSWAGRVRKRIDCVEMRCKGIRERKRREARLIVINVCPLLWLWEGMKEPKEERGKGRGRCMGREGSWEVEMAVERQYLWRKCKIICIDGRCSSIYFTVGGRR